MGKLSVCILAGGESSRMGKDKGLLDYKSNPMIMHVINAIPTNLPLFISTQNPTYHKFGYPLIHDHYPNSGPLGGIEAALTTLKSTVLFLPCDVPNISQKTIEKVIASAKDSLITIVEDEFGLHPTLGIYPYDTLSLIRAHLEEKNFKLLHTLRKFGFQTVSPIIGDLELKNFNTPKDLCE